MPASTSRKKHTPLRRWWGLNGAVKEAQEGPDGEWKELSEGDRPATSKLASTASTASCGDTVTGQLVYSPGAWQLGLEQGGEGQRAPWGEFSGVPGLLADFVRWDQRKLVDFCWVVERTRVSCWALHCRGARDALRSCGIHTTFATGAAMHAF